MLRDVPYCRSILACGMGGLILSVVLFTWVYPIFSNKVSQVKETKVREYMEDRYGISDGSVSMFTPGTSGDRELSKTLPPAAAASAGGSAPAVAPGDDAEAVPDDERLPPAKRH